MAVGLPLEHHRLRHALVADRGGLRLVLLAVLVDFVAEVLGEDRILVCEQLLVKTQVFGVLDLVLVDAVYALPGGPVAAGVDLL